MIAPMPCLMGTGEHDDVGEPWGDQQCFLAVKEVYKLLGKEENLGFYVSPGAHEVTPVMIEGYLDWLDMQFGRRPYSFENKLIYTYSFDAWKNLTGEDFNINSYPKKGLEDILLDKDGKTMKSKEEWEIKAMEIKKRINTINGKLPEYDKVQQVALENERKFRNTLVKADMPLGNGLTARLTWPVQKKDKLAVVIYLHGYLDANGYNWARAYGYNVSAGERIARNGFLAVEFDQFGYGLRNRDAGIEFFAENKNLSALGMMVSDISKIIDAVGLLEMVDQEKIVVAGYSLGGLVALYAALFDNRIKAVASAYGFGSMRLDVHGNQTEGIRRYSHLRPTIPRLGLFLDNEERIPYDFHEVLGLIAPRPVFVLAPKLDQDWFYEDVEICCHEAAKIYDLYGKEKGIAIYSPDDFNRYPPEYQEKVNSWITALFK